jgi:hypothetical protein
VPATLTEVVAIDIVRVTTFPTNFQGRLASLAAAPAAGGRRRPSSPAPRICTSPKVSAARLDAEMRRA